MKRVAILFLLGIGGFAEALAEEVSTPAQACQLTSFDGRQAVDLAKFESGKVRYVDFWASWCGPCAASFPFLNQLQAELGARGFTVVGVNVDENHQDALDFLQRRPAKFVLLQDPDGKCPQIYGVTAMPSSYIIDKEGNIRHVHLGFKEGDKADIRAKIQALLAE